MNIEKLIALADEFDRDGEEEAANEIDNIIQSMASEELEKQPAVEPSLTTVFEQLADIADTLDDAGQNKCADMIDGFIKKHAGPVLKDELDWKEPDKSKYDAEEHHKKLVREPKRDQERVDREGRQEHHIETYDPSKGTLQTRYCPDHVGDMLARVGEGTYQCPRDGAIFNWQEGYTTFDGVKVPGASISGQTPSSSGVSIPHRVFDTRYSPDNPGT